MAQVVEDRLAAIRGSQTRRVERGGQRVFVFQQEAPHRGITDHDYAVFILRLRRLGKLVRSEHGLQVVQAEVVSALRIIAVREALAAGQQPVVEGQAT